MAMAAWTDGIQGREEQREIKRRALLRTAAQAFIETGYHQTTLDDLARRLGVTKPTLYYYVKSKEDILFECLRLALEEAEEALANARAHGATGREKLRRFLLRYAEVIVSPFGACLALTRGQPLSAEAQERLRASRAAIDSEARKMLAEGIADGSIAPCDPKLASFALFGALNSMAHWFHEGGARSASDIADEMLTLFEHGLAPR